MMTLEKLKRAEYYPRHAAIAGTEINRPDSARHDRNAPCHGRVGAYTLATIRTQLCNHTPPEPFSATPRAPVSKQKRTVVAEGLTRMLLSILLWCMVESRHFGGFLRVQAVESVTPASLSYVAAPPTSFHSASTIRVHLFGFERVFLVTLKVHRRVSHTECSHETQP